MDYEGARLISLSPCAGWNVVYADDRGDPELEPIACWAIYRISGEDRVVAMTRSFEGGAGLVPADHDPMFVGLSAPGEDVGVWEEACREHFEEMGGELEDERDSALVFHDSSDLSSQLS